MESESIACLRCSSSSSAGKVAFWAMSASTRPAASRLASGAVIDRKDPSAPAPLFKVAPSASSSAAIRSALRLVGALGGELGGHRRQPGLAARIGRGAALHHQGHRRQRHLAGARGDDRQPGRKLRLGDGRRSDRDRRRRAPAEPRARPPGASALGGRTAGGTDLKRGIGIGLVQSSAWPAGRALSSR